MGKLQRGFCILKAFIVKTKESLELMEIGHVVLVSLNYYGPSDPVKKFAYRWLIINW